MKKFIIALDCMGFENKPIEAILAAIKFNEIYPNINFLLFGPKEIIEPHIQGNPNLTCVNATEVITMEDNPITARRKTNSSMYQAIYYVLNNKADAVLSAGSSAAYIALCYMLLGKISSGIKPGFMSWVPTIDKKGFYFLDVGANKEFTGKELYNLGLLANQFLISSKHINNPRIGLLNIGTEAFKGFAYHQEANELFLKNKKMNYVGFLEPRYLINGVCDILIADGYSGNLVLKSFEGSFKSMAKILKTSYKKNPLGALFSLNVIRQITKTFDYKNNAGALILGLQKIAMKTHGSADFKQFYSSLRMAKEILEVDLIDKIKSLNDLV